MILNHYLCSELNKKIKNMEQKINAETLASSLVDGYMDAEDLRKEIISIKRDYVWSWMAVSDENMHRKTKNEKSNLSFRFNH